MKIKNTGEFEGKTTWQWKNHVIGGTATTVAVIIILTLVIPGLWPILTEYETSDTWYLTNDNDYMDFIGASFYNSGEKWHVEFSASASIIAYLVDEDTLYASISCHCITGWIDKKSGKTGTFDLSVSTPGNYMVMFVGTQYTEVDFSTIEYKY